MNGWTARVERGTGADIGCKRDAIATARGELNRIGAGVQRTAYADRRNRFVYKIENGGWDGANRAEFEAFMGGELRARGLAQYGSPVALFTVTDPNGREYEILAMPFRAQASHAASRAEMNRFMSRGGNRLPDMHGGNFRVTANGRIKITDLGFGAERRGW